MNSTRAGLGILLGLCVSGCEGWFPSAHAGGEHGSAEAALPRAAAIVAEVQRDNAAFVQGHRQAYFQPFMNEQHPRAVVVACSDSRFHEEAMDRTPDGDLFMIRNIGNQVDVAAGSVEYGIRHLHAPVLIIVGHVGCGAVKAAMGDYSQESSPIRHELDGLHLSLLHGRATGTTEERWLPNVLANVNQQVADAMSEYRNEISEGRLFVVGAVYDFRGEMGKEAGSLHIINVNGEQDAERMHKLPIFSARPDMKDPARH